MVVANKTKEFSNACVIKARYITNILRGDNALFPDKNLVIGQEVMYGKKQNFADLVILYKNKLYAIEIKAQKDNFKRLDTQIESYKKVFDYVYILATNNHIASLRKLNYKDVGIISIDNDNFKIIKRGRLQKSFSNIDILESIPAAYLSKKFSLRKNMSAGSVRSLLQQKKTSDLKKVLFEYLNYKIEDKFKNFIEDSGEDLQYEDISLLSITNARVLK